MININKPEFIEAFKNSPYYERFNYTESGLCALYDYLNSDLCNECFDLQCDGIISMSERFPQYENVVWAAMDYGWCGSGVPESEQENEAREYLLESEEITILNFEDGVILVG
jgi:hypothetical protein